MSSSNNLDTLPWIAQMISILCISWDDCDHVATPNHEKVPLMNVYDWLESPMRILHGILYNNLYVVIMPVCISLCL